MRVARGTCTISLGGKQIAYIAATDAGLQVYLLRMTELESRLVPGTEVAGNAWTFPLDGEWLASANVDGVLRKVSLSGGLRKTLCDYGKIVNGFHLGNAWTPNGDALIFGSGSGLLRVPTAGGTPEPLTESGVGASWQQILLQEARRCCLLFRI